MLIFWWACLAVVAYVYFGYPLLLSMGAFGRRKPLQSNAADSSPRPLISIIVAAHNEESQIGAKLENLLAAQYPREKREILIGSDGSSDATEDIVHGFAHEGIGLVSFPHQQGKSAMQNRLVAAASGEILILTDADCFFAPDAISLALDNFADPAVGLVTARPRYLNEGDTAITQNESLYLRCETWLRRQESERGLLAMASGSFVAIRRHLWRTIDAHWGDDFVLPLRVAHARLHNVLDERIGVTTQLSEAHPRAMLRTKVRIISKDFRCLLAHGRLLNPIRFGALSAALWSHKLLRWFVPYFLLGLLLSNFLLLQHVTFRLVLALQIGFYSIALLGFALRGRLRGLVSVPTSFCLVNVAALLGTLRCFARRSSSQWTPYRTRSSTLRANPQPDPGQFK